MSSPFKPSDLSFIPELFFDLIARILPGSLILGVIYLYLIANNSILQQIECFLDSHKNLPKPPGWFLVFLLIGLSYYFAVGFAIIFRNFFDDREQMKKMEKNIRLIYNRDNVPVEEQPRFLRIIAEKCAAISLQMGLSIVSLVALSLTIVSYYINNSGSFSLIDDFLYFCILSLPIPVFVYGRKMICLDKRYKLNLKAIITLIFIYFYTLITEVYLFK